MEIIKEETFNKLDLDDYEIPPPPKYVETRGFMYVIKDSAFPDFVKIGRTQNVKKRLMQYNADKPYPTSELVCISREFEDVITVEKKILGNLYKKTPPSTFSREWFPIEFIGDCLHLIEEAEDYFE